MAPASSLAQTIAQSEYGTHTVGTLLLVRLRVTHLPSGRLRSLQMAPASSLAHPIAQSEYGTHTVGTLLLVRLRVTHLTSRRLRMAPASSLAQRITRSVD